MLQVEHSVANIGFGRAENELSKVSYPGFSHYFYVVWISYVKVSLARLFASSRNPFENLITVACLGSLCGDGPL